MRFSTQNSRSFDLVARKFLQNIFCYNVRTFWRLEKSLIFFASVSSHQMKLIYDKHLKYFKRCWLCRSQWFIHRKMSLVIGSGSFFRRRTPWLNMYSLLVLCDTLYDVWPCADLLLYNWNWNIHLDHLWMLTHKMLLNLFLDGEKSSPRQSQAYLDDGDNDGDEYTACACQRWMFVTIFMPIFVVLSILGFIFVLLLMPCKYQHHCLPFLF